MNPSADDLERTVLAQLDHPGLVAAFARAYEDYVIPLRFDAERMRLHVTAHDIALAHSPLWRDRAGGLVALGMLGIRQDGGQSRGQNRGQDRGWIGGFGVAPEHRGHGLSHPLCAELVERARALGLSRLSLEVLENNPRAIATYERAGFRRTRMLCSYRREPGRPSSLARAPELVEIDIDAVSWARVSPAPAWQREPASVLRMPDLRAIACDEAVAVVRATTEGVHVLAILAEDETSAARLLDAVAARHPDRATLVMNEPEGSPAQRAMARHGWTPIVRQHEMVLPLDTPPR
jgi:ribosomal protein S18 acetylase RimI-like enzyme